MAENTLISWADDTLNVWAGCTRISNGPKGACVACYAANLMDDRMHKVKFGGPGEGVGTRLEMKHWRSELQKIERKAAAGYRETGAQRFVFVNSLSDFFDNHPDCAPWRRAFFEEVRALPERGFDRPHIVFLLLTKRPQNILKMVRAAGDLPPSCALGTTTENMQTLSLNSAALMAALGVLKDLDQTPAAFGFLSCEPLMEALDLGIMGQGWAEWIRWVITGGESDQGKHRARPSYPGWFRGINDQCIAAGAVFHHKQNGEHLEEQALAAAGIDPRTLPADRVVVVDGVLYGKVGADVAGRRLNGQTYDGRPVA